MNIENEVLITLLNASGRPLTATVIHRRVAARHLDEAPSWREVANAVSRLSTRGWVAITDEEVVGEDVHPMFSLTAAGDMAARQLRAQAQLEGAKNGIRINQPPSRAARLREMGIPSRTFYTVREELRDAGVEHTEQDIIEICKARRRA